jgi:hypothetical protein
VVRSQVAGLAEISNGNNASGSDTVIASAAKQSSFLSGALWIASLCSQ